MSETPSPLLPGSPAQYRTSSQDSVPSVLQVGSPALSQSPVSFYQPTPPRRNSSRAEDRLSQLFPARPPSAASLARPNRRDSSSSSRHIPPSIPLVPATQPAQSSYAIPEAPAPPSFSVDTSYGSSRDPSDTIISPTGKTSRSKSILNRLGSLRSSNFLQRNARYNQLEDEEGDIERNRRLNKVTEEDDDDPIGYDISGFGGPIAMQSMDRAQPGHLASYTGAERDITAAGYETEFERLEAVNKSAVIGGGMAEVIETPLESQAAMSPAPKRAKTQHRKGLSNSNMDAQMAADEQGEILAVPEPPAFDISNYGGGDIETRSLATDAAGYGKEQKTSYYFPPDPDMPNWRPVSMHWAYIVFLIVIALTLAVVQEYLCQLSIQKTQNDDGLLKFKEADELSVLQYFTWKYAPTMILVTYGILWQVTDYEVKRLEPFYQLSRREGATAAQSVNIDYLTFFSYFVPIKAIKHRQWAVFLSSFGYLVAGSLVPVLQSAAVGIYPEKDKRRADEDKFVRMDPPWSRAVTAMLVIVALVGVALLFLSRRKSGLQSDPKGIAGVAAMATKSHILADFKGLDTAPQHEIHKQLRHRRYILHKSSLWQGEYIRTDSSTLKDHSRDSRPALLTKRTGLPYIGFIILVMVLIPVFMFDPRANTVTEKIPFLLTAIATLLKLLWGTMDMAVRLMEPFFILSRRNAPPSTLTLDYTGTIPGYLSIRAFLNKHYLVALVGLGAIFTEVLTVCASSFSVDGLKFLVQQGGPDELGDRPDHDDHDGSDSFNSGETFKSFWVSFGLSLLILSYLAVVAGLTLYLRSKRVVPRTPGTIASTLAFIHQSKMLETFIGTETFDSGKMTKWLESKGKQYGLGWFNGRDGEDHCGIEEEPLLAGYEWGKDWRESRMTGNVIGQWEHL